MHNECQNYHAAKTDRLCTFLPLSDLNGNADFLLCSVNNRSSQGFQQIQPALMSPADAVSDISRGWDTLTAVTGKWNGFLWEAERLFVSQSKQAESQEEIDTDIFRLLTAPLIYYWCLGPTGLNLGCATTLDLDQWTQGRCADRKRKEFQKKCEYQSYKTQKIELGFTGSFRVINDTGS